MVRLYTPIHRRYSDQGIIVPNVELSEGIRPFIGTEVAPYLPVQQLEEYHGDHYSILTGKAVSMDSLGFVTLAGLRLQMDAVRDDPEYANGAAGSLDFGVADADGIIAGGALTLYDATDVAQAVWDARGAAAVANEPVIWAFLRDTLGNCPMDFGAGDNTTAFNPAGVVDPSGTIVNTDVYNFEFVDSVTVGYPQGVAPYSYYRSSRNLTAATAAAVGLTRPFGANVNFSVFSPTGLRQHNYNKQGRVAILCDYACEYPWVTTAANVLIEGMAVFQGALQADAGVGPRPGDFVTINAASNLVLEGRVGGNANNNGGWEQAPVVEGLDLGNGDAGLVANQRALENRLGRFAGYRMGQLLRVQDAHVDTAYLTRVRSRFEDNGGFAGATSDFTDIDRLPGTATGGQPWNVWAAGRTDAAPAETGSVIVNLISR